MILYANNCHKSFSFLFNAMVYKNSSLNKMGRWKKDKTKSNV